MARLTSQETFSGPDRTLLAAGSLVRFGDRSADQAVFEAEVVTFFLNAAEMLGVPKSIAAIYGICFATAQPLSFADIAARLAISQGSLSQGLRLLKEMGALKVVGSFERREYFAPDLEMRKLATRFIEDRIEKQLKEGKHRLQRMRAVIPAGDESAATELKARLKYLQSWHDKARGIVPLAKTFLKLP